MSTSLPRLWCRLRGHRYIEHRVAVDGTLVVVNRCDRCKHVDVEGIEVTAWNRQERRRHARSVAKTIVDGHGRRR